MDAFDDRRALLLERDIFVPFRVTTTPLLRDALARGDIAEDAPVLAIELAESTLTLPRRQLLYHHVAQGELAGQPWMVSF
jgi:hypothetical protein